MAYPKVRRTGVRLPASPPPLSPPNQTVPGAFLLAKGLPDGCMAAPMDALKTFRAPFLNCKSICTAASAVSFIGKAGGKKIDSHYGFHLWQFLVFMQVLRDLMAGAKGKVWSGLYSRCAGRACGAAFFAGGGYGVFCKRSELRDFT